MFEDLVQGEVVANGVLSINMSHIRRRTCLKAHLPRLLVAPVSEPLKTIFQCCIDLLKSELLVRATVNRQLDKYRIRLVRFLSLRRIREGPQVDVLVGRDSQGLTKVRSGIFEEKVVRPVIGDRTDRECLNRGSWLGMECT